MSPMADCQQCAATVTMCNSIRQRIEMTARLIPRPIAQALAAAFRPSRKPLLVTVLLTIPIAHAAITVVDDFSTSGTWTPVASGVPNQQYGYSTTWDATDLAFDCCRYAGFDAPYSNPDVWGGTRNAMVRSILQQGSVSTGSLNLDSGAGSLVAALTNSAMDSAGNGKTGWSFLALSYGALAAPIADVGKNAVLRISFDEVYTSAASGQFQIDMQGQRTSSGANAGIASALISNSGSSTTATIRLTDHSALQSLYFSFWSVGVQAGQTIASQIVKITSIVLDMTPVRALNSLLGATESDNVTITADESLGTAVSVNSLTVSNASIRASSSAARITVVGDDAAGAWLTTSGAVTLAPVLAFSSQSGRVAVDGKTVLAGGVVASKGLTVSGRGFLELGAAGTVLGKLSTASGVTLVLSADDAAQGAAIRLDAGSTLDIGTTRQHVLSLTGPVNGRGNPVGYAVLRGTGTLVADDLIMLKQEVVDAQLVGRTLSLYSPGSKLTLNGNLQASFSLSVGSWDGAGQTTFNGVVSGAGSVYGYSSSNHDQALVFTQRNTYTGQTHASGVSLLGDASIASSAGVNAQSITVSTKPGDNPTLDRFGDKAQISLLSRGLDPAQAGVLRVQAAAGLNLVEDIGTLGLSGGRGLLDLSNGGGSVALRADRLDLKGPLYVNLGSSSSLAVDTAPALYAGTNLIQNVWVTRTANGGSMPTWATFNADGLGSVTDTPIAALRIADAGAQAFVRLSAETNTALDANHTIAGLGIDTTQTLTGSGTLTLTSGQLMLWQDNTVALATLQAGAGLTVSNAGNNTISSAIRNTSSVTKLGSGTLVLTGVLETNRITVTEGKLVMGAGSAFGGGYASNTFQVMSTGTLEFGGAQQHEADGGFIGSGAVLVAAGATLKNRAFAGLPSVQITNLGTIENSGATKVANNQGNVSNTGYLQIIQNTGIVQNADTGTLLLNGLANAGSVVNAGRAELDKIYTATSMDAAASYRQTAGMTVINGSFYGDIQLDGGTLGGSGHIIGNVLASQGAVVAPGNSPGTLTVDGVLHLTAGAVLALQLDSSGVDQVVAGSFLFEAGAVIQFDFGTSGYSGDDFLPGSGGAAPRFSLAGLFRLQDGSQLDYSVFAATTLAGLTTSDGRALTQITADGQVSAVPEPSALSMLLAGLGAVAWRARGKRQLGARRDPKLVATDAN